jgi:hypothetical protein
VFGTNFINLTTVLNNSIPSIVKVYCGRTRDLYTIRYLGNTVRLGPQGTFIYPYPGYLRSWEPLIGTENFLRFYGSRPPPWNTSVPSDEFVFGIDNLSEITLDYIMEKYDLQKKENKPKNTQQVYTGKRLIQL